ncbi:MAG: hypothetical protein QF915_02470 [Candidatus Woesearchaeota archaeon]|jgi:hypothetical protein|nr:hypothetical protein [Candidatus Woesearchaeota archaeon]MDP7458328.1 hypothetical protein [Candidatus Woesearchaeota archaeon]
MEETKEVVGKEDNSRVDSDEDTSINLGPQIEMVHFKQIERGSMPVIKKIVGHGVKLLSEKAPKFERMKITLKKVHSGHGQYELHGQAIIAGKPITSEVTNRNLFFALSDLLKKIENQINS